MARKKVAPHGQWQSPISVDSVVATREFSTPRVSPRTGRAFFRESRPDGSNTIVEIVGDGVKEVLPAPYSAANRVYEYGASLLDVLPDDRIVFSNHDDAVCVVEPDAQRVRVVVPTNPAQRYGSFGASAASAAWILAIQEDHTHDTPDKVRNRVVGIHVESGEVKTLVEGADFYYAPRFSCDGKRVSWLEWNRPDMPFDAAQLYVAEWKAGEVGERRLVAGQGKKSVAEPCWGLDGTLFFAMEQGPYRQLYKVAPGGTAPTAIELKGLEEAEFGEMGHTEGCRAMVPLANDCLVAAPCIKGVQQLIAIDLKTSQWRRLVDEKTLCQVQGDAMARLDDSSVLVVGSGTMSLPAVWRIDVHKPGAAKMLRKSTETDFPTSIYSLVEPLQIQPKASRARDIYGFLWMPHNPDFGAAEGSLPPLIVVSHGGPTDRTGCGLKLRTQYFTSRGYAVLGLNYSGSTGYGRDYRNALFGHWGVLDADDAGECAVQLAAAGRVRASGIGLTGISAGGYNTLQGLVRHGPVFAAAMCVAGISELAKFEATTHKLEMDYAAALVLPAEARGVDAQYRERVYRERSPVHHVDQVVAPLLVLHGRADTVVDEMQPRLMAEALKAKGGDVEVVLVEGEGHLMAKPTSMRLWLELEEKMWTATLLS